MKKNILDSSSGGDYMRCERLYYYTCVRGWQPEGVNINTHHGDCYHKAMDKLWAGSSIAEAVQCYCDAFALAEMTPDEVARGYPKNPDRIQEALEAYMERYGAWMDTIELLHWEMPIAVTLMLDEPCKIVGRVDKVFRDKQGIWILDHKTTKSMGPAWTNQFLPDFQVETYTYMGRKLFGPEFKGIIIDGALFQKADKAAYEKKEKVPASAGWFKRVPVEMNPFIDETYRFELMDLFLRLRKDYSLLEAERATLDNQAQHIMRCFPRRTKACHYYGGCPYRTLCYSWKTPETRKAPIGFKEQFWSPFDLSELDGPGAREVLV